MTGDHEQNKMRAEQEQQLNRILNWEETKNCEDYDYEDCDDYEQDFVPEHERIMKHIQEQATWIMSCTESWNLT